jgi:hypothetical protein
MQVADFQQFKGVRLLPFSAGIYLKHLINRVLSAEIEFSVNIAYFCPRCHRILRNTDSLTGRDTIHS